MTTLPILCTKALSGDRSARRTLRLAALALSVATLACGNYGGGSSSGSGTGSTTAFVGGGSGGVDAGASLAAFSATAYPMLTANCSACHAGAGPGFPHIAHANPQTAYDAVVGAQKVNLANPAASRLVQRLAVDFHYCWSGNCVDDGNEMAAAITAWAAQIDFGGGGGTQVASGIASNALQLADGVIDAGDQRYNDGIIALWEFKEEGGIVAFETSGIEPRMDLRLREGVTFMSSWGINIEEGMADTSRDASRKLYDLIADPTTGSQQYSVEAWVTPANTTQDGPARIISYSRGGGQRNFTVGQNLYNYVFRNRSVHSEVSNNGTPQLETYNNDEDLQATLQHVVMTYDQYRGRRIWVNGEWTDDEDPSMPSEFDPGRLWNWDPGHTFVIGNETNGGRLFQGQVRHVAIYDRTLSESQIRQNFAAGIGKRVLMTFDVSQWAGPGAALELVVSELDDYSYLVCEPSFITPNPSNLQVGPMHILVNGQRPVSGQAFSNVNALVSEPKQRLSRMCSVISKDLGPLEDLFSVEFEILGQFENQAVEEVPPVAPVHYVAATLPQDGVRSFERVFETMVSVTGLDPTAHPLVSEVYEDIKGQLPTGPDPRSFSSSAQVGISKLALEFCDALVDSPAERDLFFDTGFDFTSATDFGQQSQRDRIVDPLFDKMVVGVAGQPTRAEIGTVMNDLFADLSSSCPGVPAMCDAARSQTIVKAACATVLSSAAVTVH